MSIIPKCHVCGEELEGFGALAFSPPDHHDDCHKFHICKKCWEDVKLTLDGNGWKSVKDVLPLDDLLIPEDESVGVVTDVLVCGVFDEDEPPPNAYTHLAGYSSQRGWTCAGKYHLPHHYADKITHWMPLPEPHPNAGEHLNGVYKPKKSIGYAGRMIAILVKHMTEAAERIAPEGAPPCLSELRREIERMTSELEQRIPALKSISDCSCAGDE